MKPSKVLAFALRPQGEGALEIDVYETIGEDPWTGEGVSAKDVLSQLKGAGKLSSIRLRINSTGGNVFDGIAIYNLLRDWSNKGATVEVDIDGIAASAASIIAVSGDEIRIAKNAILMIHKASTVAWGNADEIEKTVSALRQIDESLSSTYESTASARGKEKTAGEFSALMTAETWLTSDEALELGLVDSITEPVAIAASLRPEDAARFLNVPLHLVRAVAEMPPSPDPITEAPAASAMQALSATTSEPKETPIVSEKLFKALGATNEDEALAIVAKSAIIIQAAESASTVAEELTALTGKPLAQVVAVVQAWKLGSERLPDAEAQAAAAKAELTRRDAEATQAKLDSAIKAGLESGKLTTALEPWARTQTLESIEAFLAAAPGAVPGAGAAPVVEPARAGIASLTAEDRKVAARMGITLEDFAAAKSELSLTTHGVDDADEE